MSQIEQEGTAQRPQISFGVIVLNGEPFTKHTLRSVYSYAYEIIVSEGAAPGARGIATKDGHSRDGTLEALREFRKTEDPEGKVTIVTAEDEGHPDGFWPGEKDEQSRAYATRATGDYLWQLDIDEFYLPADLEAVIAMMEDDPSISGAAFKQTTFWGSLGYWTDSWYLRQGAANYHRLFRWGPGYSYTSHRPPTVVDDVGIDVRGGNYLYSGRPRQSWHQAVPLLAAVPQAGRRQVRLLPERELVREDRRACVGKEYLPAPEQALPSA